MGTATGVPISPVFQLARAGTAGGSSPPMKVHLAAALMLACSAPAAGEDPPFVALFNGKVLAGWAQVNCAPGTFTVKDGVIHSTGVPTGVLRTERQYENFVLEVEWRHLKVGGNAGI